MSEQSAAFWIEMRKASNAASHKRLPAVLYAALLNDHGLAVFDWLASARDMDVDAAWFVLIPGFERVRYPRLYAYAAIDSARPTDEEAREAVLAFQENLSVVRKNRMFLDARIVGDHFEYVKGSQASEPEHVGASPAARAYTPPEFDEPDPYDG